MAFGVCFAGFMVVIFFFLRICLHTGPLITIILCILGTDLLRFVIIYVIILLTPALAFDFQFEGEFFVSILVTIMTLFLMKHGESDDRVALEGKYQALTITIIVAMQRSHSERTKVAFQEECSVNIKSNRATVETHEEINNQSRTLDTDNKLYTDNKLDTDNMVKPPSQEECFVNVKSSKVTEVGDANIGSLSHQLKSEKRGLVVVLQQKLTVKQRKLMIKHQMLKIAIQAVTQ